MRGPRVCCWHGAPGHPTYQAATFSRRHVSPTFEICANTQAHEQHRWHPLCNDGRHPANVWKRSESIRHKNGGEVLTKAPVEMDAQDHSTAVQATRKCAVTRRCTCRDARGQLALLNDTILVNGDGASYSGTMDNAFNMLSATALLQEVHTARGRRQHLRKLLE